MRRRDLIAILGSLPIACPVGARAQQTDRIRRIGYLTPGMAGTADVLAAAETRAFMQGLGELGWTVGQNVTIDDRFAAGDRDRIRPLAVELVGLGPDVILSVGAPALIALLGTTRTIPIVFAVVGDPVASGFVASLAHPGGNATGFSVSEAPIAGKWLQLLKQIAPGVARVLVVMEADLPPQLLMRDAVAEAGHSLGVAVSTAAIRNLAAVEHEIGVFAREPGGGLVVLSNTITSVNQQRIHALAVQYRLPAIYSYPIYTRSGGLISYGPDPVAHLHDAAGYVDRILRGAKPGDLPVQQPAKFTLIINLRTARALGLTVPEPLLDLADEVIE
jgi:putative ABC transport system substrate-binding protein